MTSTSTAKLERTDALGFWGFAILSLLQIWLGRQWPGSRPAVLASYACTTFFLAWFGSMVWTGYRRRRPHWTAESWRRYVRLAAMPVMALILLMGEVYLFDVKRNWSVWGPPESALRAAWIVIDLALMALGVVGTMMALDWMKRGEPSEPFTRTRWFRRGGVSAVSD